MHQPENVHVDMVHHDRDEPERLTGLMGASLVSGAASHDGQISMQNSDARTMRSTRMRRLKASALFGVDRVDLPSSYTSTVHERVSE